MNATTVDANLLQSRYRLTKQRAAVLRALENGTHLSAERIHELVRSEMPSVSLGTVYRTLDILHELGLVQIFSFGGRAARYEARLDRHHHLLCSNCDELLDVRWTDDVAQVARNISSAQGYSDVDFSFTIVGRCRMCATLASNGASTDGSASPEADGARQSPGVRAVKHEGRAKLDRSRQLDGRVDVEA